MGQLVLSPKGRGRTEPVRLYGLAVLRGAADPSGFWGERRLRRAGKGLRLGGALRVLVPGDFAQWPMLRSFGLRPVEPERYHVPLGDLAVGRGEPGPAAEPISEAMLVFCGMGQALLNQVLEVIRVAKLPPIPLKAVLTDSNQNWDTRQLYAELLKEREAIAAKKEEKS